MTVTTIAERKANVILLHQASKLGAEDIWLYTYDISNIYETYIVGELEQDVLKTLNELWEGRAPKFISVPKFADSLKVAEAVSLLALLSGFSPVIFELTSGSNELERMCEGGFQHDISQVAWTNAQEAAVRSNWTDFQDRIVLESKKLARLISVIDSYFYFTEPTFKVGSDNPTSLALFETSYEKKITAILRLEAVRHAKDGKSSQKISSFLKVIEQLADARRSWVTERDVKDLAAVYFLTAKMLFERSNLERNVCRDVYPLLKFRAMEFFLYAIALLFNIVEPGRHSVIMNNKLPALGELVSDIGVRLKVDETIFTKIIRTRNRSIEGHGFNAWPEESFEQLNNACFEAQKLCCAKSTFLRQLDAINLPYELGTDVFGYLVEVYAETNLLALSNA